MGIETGNFIENLDQNWPVSGDFVLEGDDHIRLTKKILKQQFPGSSGNGFSKAITATEDDINNTGGASSNFQAQIDTLNALVAAIGSTPVGGIIMYNGAFAAIPVNYLLCDGTGGTPDLTDRFVYGTNIEGELNQLGGSDDAVNIEHNHTFTGTPLAVHDHNLGAGIKSQLNKGEGQTAFSDGGDGRYDVTEDPASAGTPAGTISTEGSVGTGLNRPAFLKLAYIRRMS